jgi:MFS family permease
LPVLAESFGVSVGTASMVFVAQMVGGLAVAIPTGYAIDRFGRRKVLLAGPVVTAAAAFLVATADTFALLLLYRVIGGAGQQMWTVTRLAVIADTTEAGSRGRQITRMLGIQRVGMLTGPLIGGFAAAAWGLSLPFVIQGAIVLAAVVPSFVVARETAPDRTAHDVADAAAREESYSWRSLLRHPIPALFTAQFFAMTARGGAIGGGTVFLYAVYAYGTGPAALGLLSGVMGAVGIPATFMAGYLMDRFGRKVIIVPGLMLMGLAYAFFAATAFADLPFAAYVVAFVWIQTMQSLLTGSMQVLGADLAPPGARGKFFGAGRMVSQAAFIANPLSFALLTAVSGFTAAFGFLGATGFAGAAMLGLFVKETHPPRR